MNCIFIIYSVRQKQNFRELFKGFGTLEEFTTYLISMIWKKHFTVSNRLFCNKVRLFCVIFKRLVCNRKNYHSGWQGVGEC